MRVAPLTLGVIDSSTKENEHRLPLHPDHLSRIPAELRGQVTLEHGYGARFRRSDEELAPWVAGFASRAEIRAESDVVLLPIVLGGPDAWEVDETTSRATEVRAGHVVNPAILSFQGRSEEHPHPVS